MHLKIDLLRKVIASCWSLLSLLGLCFLWAFNSYSLSFIITFWTLILFLLTQVPWIKKTKTVQMISREVGIVSLIYTLVLVGISFKDAKLSLKKEASTLFIADDLNLINLIALKKHDPTSVLKHFAYWRYYEMWNKSKNSLRSILNGLVMDNSALIEGSIVNPSLFGFYSSKATPLEEDFFTIVEHNGLRWKLPHFHSNKIEKDRFIVSGKICSFIVSSIDSRPEPYTIQWVEENERITKFQGKFKISKLNVLTVSYAFELNCPWYLMYHPAVEKYQAWFLRMSSEYVKQMDWAEIRSIYVDFGP